MWAHRFPKRGTPGSILIKNMRLLRVFPNVEDLVAQNGSPCLSSVWDLATMQQNMMHNIINIFPMLFGIFKIVFVYLFPRSHPPWRGGLWCVCVGNVRLRTPQRLRRGCRSWPHRLQAVGPSGELACASLNPELWALSPKPWTLKMCIFTRCTIFFQLAKRFTCGAWASIWDFKVSRDLVFFWATFAVICII